MLAYAIASPHVIAMITLDVSAYMPHVPLFASIIFGEQSIVTILLEQTYCPIEAMGGSWLELDVGPMVVTLVIGVVASAVLVEVKVTGIVVMASGVILVVVTSAVEVEVDDIVGAMVDTPVVVVVLIYAEDGVDSTDVDVGKVVIGNVYVTIKVGTNKLSG